MNDRRIVALAAACTLGAALALGAPRASAQAPASARAGVLGEDADRERLEPPFEPSARLAVTEAAAASLIRVVYLIPVNRYAQPAAQQHLRYFVATMQRWLADEMELSGYTPKTFRYETEADGSTLRVNVLSSARPDTDFHGGYLERWGNVLTEVEALGFPLWQPGQLVFIVAEMQIQEPDGSFRESSVFVGGAGGDSNGVAMVTGETLARLSEELLTDDRPYDGLVVPDIGPYSLVQDVSFAWFEGTTLSSTSSSAHGAAFHELAHGFGLPHDFRNDSNFNGNLMGNGLRGVRGALFPERYPADDTRLSTASSLVLNYSRFLNAPDDIVDASAPGVYLSTAGSVTPVNGLCRLELTAWDFDSGLAGAVLLRGGQAVADTTFAAAPQQIATALATYSYEPGIEEEWQVLVIDMHGNRGLSEPSRVTCATGENRAPWPFVRVSSRRLDVGELVTLDAESSFDPDGSWDSLEVEWDVDGDGTFDTPRSRNKTREVSYAEPGVYRVAARVTDESGDSALSMPIGLRVGRAVQAIDIDIRPWAPSNVVNPHAQGFLWVAVLARDGFDPLEIDVATARFGAGGALAVERALIDVDRDGRHDLLLKFRIRHAGILCDDREATLEADTRDGRRVVGADALRTVGCGKPPASGRAMVP